MGTVFFFLTIFAIPGFPSGALVGRWGVLAATAAYLFFWCRLSWGAVALLAYLAAMSWITPVGYEAINLYFHAVFLVILYCYAKQMADFRKLAIGASLGMAINSAFMIAQHFDGLWWIPELTRDGGLYFNHNMAGEAAGMILALAVGYRLWWLVPGVLPSLYFGARSAVLGLGVAAFLWVWARSKGWALATLVAAPLVVYGTHIEYITESQGGWIGPFTTLFGRFDTWNDVIKGFTITGQGFGSFITNFTLYQHATSPLEIRWEQAHNDALQLIFELGIIGAALCAAFIYRLAIAERRPEFYALVVFVVEGTFGFPLYIPVTAALAALCAGHLFARGRYLRDDLLRLGLLLCARYSAGRHHQLLSGSNSVPAQSRPKVRTRVLRRNSRRLLTN